MAHTATLLTLGRPHVGLLHACLGSGPRRKHFERADLARIARERARRAASLFGALLLFLGAVLAARELYLRGEPEIAALVIRKAHEETLRPDRARLGPQAAQARADALHARPEPAGVRACPPAPTRP